MRAFPFLAAAVLTAGMAMTFPAGAADDKAAEKILKDNDCAKCHTLAREKEGPPYRKIAEKYKGKADAEQKLFAHLTSEPVVKVDGKDEKHKKIQGSEAEVKNLAQWILTR
jgi:cytochrome c